MNEVDQNTLDVMKVMGVEIEKPNTPPPTKHYSLEEIKQFLEQLDEPKPQDTEPKTEPEVQGETKTNSTEAPKPSEPLGDSFEQILKDLEELSKERSDAAEQVKETQQQIQEKVQEVKDGTGNSETLKEIVQLNAKLQAELEVYKNSDEANKAKIKELSDKINYYELDDSRVNVPEDLKGAVKYLINFYESKNESFKIKAMEEMVKALEKLGEHPIGPYIDDVVAKQLKVISSLSGDSSPIPIQNKQELTPLQKYVQAHGIPKEL